MIRHFKTNSPKLFLLSLLAVFIATVFGIVEIISAGILLTFILLPLLILLIIIAFIFFIVLVAFIIMLLFAFRLKRDGNKAYINRKRGNERDYKEEML